MCVVQKLVDASQLMTSYINNSTSICPFESENCWKEGKKLQKFEYLKTEKSFFDEGLSFGKKIKFDKKIADTSFNQLQIPSKKSPKKYKFVKQKLTQTTQTICIFVYFNFIFTDNIITQIFLKKNLSTLQCYFIDN